MAFQLIDSSAGGAVDVTSGTGASLDVIIGCTLQTDDVVLLCHWHERNNNNVSRRVPLDSNGAHPTGFDCVTEVSGVDQNWGWFSTCYNTSGSVGSAAEIGVGVYSYKVTSTDAKDNVVVTLTQPVAASATNTSKCVVRVLVLRGVEYTNSANTAVVARSSRYPATNNNNTTSQSHILWDDPTVTSTNYWNSTTYSGEVLGVYLGAMRPSNGIDPGESTPNNVTTTAVNSWHTGVAADSTTASTTPAGFSTTTRGHTQVVCIMSYADFSAASFTNRYLSRDGSNSTGDQASIFLPFGIAASAGTTDVTGTATAGTVAASATVGTQRSTADLSGTSTVGTFASSGTVTTQVASETDVSGTVTAGTFATSATVAAQRNTLDLSDTVTAGNVSASATVDTNRDTVNLSLSVTASTVAASATVNADTETTDVSGTLALGTVSASATVATTTDIQVSSTVTVGTVGASATVDTQRETADVSGTLALGTVGASVTLSTAGISDLSGTVTAGTTAASVSVDVDRDTRQVSGTITVGSVASSATVTSDKETTDVSGTATAGTIATSVTVSATSGLALSGTSTAGTVGTSATVSSDTTVKNLTLTQAIGTVEASVTVGTQRETADVSGSITAGTTAVSVTVTTVTDIQVSSTVTAGTVGASGVVVSEAIVDVSGTLPIGAVSATVSVQSSSAVFMAVTIDGVGDIVENLLTRSEIVAIEEIWNTGLTQLGVGRVDSATADNSAQAALLRAVWPNFRKQFISDHAWNGCKTTAQLTALPDSDFKDTTRWSNIFSLPSDYIRALTVNGHKNQPDNTASTMWEIEVVANTSGAKSRCLCTNQSNAKLEYVFDVGDNVDLLAPAMKHAMGLAFGAFVAPNFGKSANEIALLEQKVKENLLKARGIDGQESSGKFFSSTDLVDSRYRSI